MIVYYRLFRTPIRSFLWILLLSISFLPVNLGFAFWQAANLTTDTIGSEYTTIAVLRPQVKETEEGEAEKGVEQLIIQPGLTDWEIESLEALDMVEMVDERLMTSAYSPEWGTLLSMQTEEAYHSRYDEPYREILFSGTVLETEYIERTYPGREDSAIYSNTAVLAIDEVYLIHEGYRENIRDTIKLYWNSTRIPIDPLKEGARYLVYGKYTGVQMVLGMEFGEPFVNVSSDIPRINNFSSGGNGMERFSDPKVMAAYEHPTMAEFTGTLDEFLEDPDHWQWKRVMEEWEITKRSVPMIGTDCLESIYQFQQKQAVITRGRGFTKEDYENGNAVCVISEVFAAANGIAPGDRIPIYQYPCLDRSGSDSMYSIESRNPAAAAYSIYIGLPDQAQEFLVVGLYRLEELWNNEAFSVTPNTVYVPKNALAEGARGTRQEVFVSLKLKNGTQDEFHALWEGTKQEERFLTFDQGYSENMEEIRKLENSALLLFFAGCAAGLLVMALYLVLYQKKESRNLMIMRALGTERRQTGRYLFVSGYLLSFTAVILAGITGILTSGVLSGILAGTFLDAGVSEGAADYSISESVDALTIMEVFSSNQGVFAISIAAICLVQVVLYGFVLWYNAKRMTDTLYKGEKSCVHSG